MLGAQGLLKWRDFYPVTQYVLAKIFFLRHGDVTIADERLQNLDLCLTLRAFEQGGMISPAWHESFLVRIVARRIFNIEL
jgi:hypothetical protein